MKYFIDLVGCEDNTPFVMDLTDAEAETVKKIGEMSQKVSIYGCMPKLYIMPFADCDEFDLWMIENAKEDLQENEQ